MAWRKWIVRGVVYGISGACVLAALLYQRWTNPSAVREQIIAKLTESFPGAHVSVDSARLRILGGIQLNGLRLTRADDPEKHEFLHVPSAIFYHDKEKILEGELTLRKIELMRPRLRVRRERDGKWNLQGISKQLGAPLASMPTLVIHQGTLILEDHSDHARPSSLEINDISLTILNDPLPTVTIRGAANSVLLGKLQVNGRLDRVDNSVAVSFKASRIPVTQALAARFPNQCPPEMLAGLNLQAIARVHGQVSYQPTQIQPWYYDIHCEVQDGIVQHPQLPLPLENLQARLHCSGGELHLEKLTARSGTAEIAAQGVALVSAIDKNFEVQLDLKHVTLGTKLAERLPEKLRNLHEMFKPNGPTSVHLACARHEGHWVSLSNGEPSQVSLHPEEISMEFVNFPYLLQRTIGDVDYNILNKRVEVRVIGHAGDQPVELRGHWTGEGSQADVDFQLKGFNVPIEEKLIKALPVGLQKIVDSFHANGKIDLIANLKRVPGEQFRNEYHIHIHDAALCSDYFPYSLKKVRGNLRIYPEHWEFNDFEGTHREGKVHVTAKSTPKLDDKQSDPSHGINLEIVGRNIQLDDDLRDAFRPMPNLHKAWETFNPDGPLHFTAIVNRPNSNTYDLDVDVTARGCSVRPTFFPYRLQDLSGKFRYHHNRLEIAKLRARHEQTIFAMNNGTVDLHSRGGYYADMHDLQIHGIKLDEDLVQAVPRKLQDCIKSLHLADPLRIETRLIVAQPPETGKPADIYWDGEVRMYNAKFSTGLEFSNATGTLACLGRYNGRQLLGVYGNLLLDQATLYNQPFKNIHARFQVHENAPDTLLVGLRAPVFGGDVTGQARVDFNYNSTLRYEMNMTASQINVAEFGRHNLGPKSQLAGTANARLYLTGLGTGMDSLEGNGSVDIPRGHFYNLPFLFDLLKFIGLRGPDRTAFEEFHTVFAAQGSRVDLQRFDLLGSTVSLSGKGDYDLRSKNLQLDVYPMWGRVEQLLPPSVRPFPTTVSKNLLTVEVRGKLGNAGDMKYHLKPIPIFVDPFLLLRDRVIGQQGSTGSANDSRNTSIGPGVPVVNPAPEPERKRMFRIWD